MLEKHVLLARIFVRGVCFLLGVGHIPVEDSTDEGGDEGGTGLCTQHCLAQREHEGHVTVDALRFQHFARRDALVRTRQLDQNAVPVINHCVLLRKTKYKTIVE